MLKKKLCIRAALGAPIGLAISTAITIASSLLQGDGTYYPVVPELIDACGSEINAVALQALLSLLYGAVFAGASVIWEKDDWSPLRQTLLHLAVCCTATLPVAYTLHWMAHTLRGILSYFALFLAIYATIWCWQYFSIKKRVAQINDAINAKKDR